MQPVSPVLTPELVSHEVVYAKDQPQYNPLPVIRNSRGVLLSRWKLTEEEREAVAFGADIFLSNWTFNQPLQPVRIEVGECDRDLMAIAASMDLIPFDTTLPDDTVFSERTIQVPDLTKSQESAEKES